MSHPHLEEVTCLTRMGRRSHVSPTWGGGHMSHPHLEEVTCLTRMGRRSQDSPVEVRVPLKCVYVHQHGTTGIGHVCYVHTTIHPSCEVLCRDTYGMCT